MAKSSPRKKPLSKTQLIANISAAANVPKKKVAEVLSVLVDEIEKCLTARHPRRVAIPGVMEFWVEKEAARPARKRVPNPFDPREIIDIPAKPATTKIKAKALRLIKEAIAPKVLPAVTWVEHKTAADLPAGLVSLFDRDRDALAADGPIATFDCLPFITKKTVTIHCIRPDKITSRAILKSFRAMIEEYIRGGRWIPMRPSESDRLYANWDAARLEEICLRQDNVPDFKGTLDRFSAVPMVEGKRSGPITFVWIDYENGSMLPGKHGVEFHDRARVQATIGNSTGCKWGDTLVAVPDGLPGWKPNVMLIRSIRPDSVTTRSVLNDFRCKIESIMAGDQSPPDRCDGSGRLYMEWNA